MRYIYILISAMIMALAWSVSAQATKMTPPGVSCTNVRCGFGTTCIETPGGPICQQPSLSCANVLCAQGNQCVETSTGPQCVPARPAAPTTPSYPSHPVQPTYPQQSCAYGGYYHHGQLTCYPPPAWRHPYQYGWGQYYNPPPRYVPPRPVPRPVPAPRPPWHPQGPDYTKPAPDPGFCTMEYDPVCAEKPVICVKAPCSPVRKTFGNNCQAKQDGYTVLYKGVCR